MDDLKLIKKYYGEKMAHLCRELFPSLLETKGLLFKLLEDNFQYSKFLCDDILDYDLVNDFQNYIYKLILPSNRDKEQEVKKDPYELMKEAGYTLYKCETEEDIQRFKKYYREDEELCTFRGGRLNTCDVFFAVKDNADEIKREDFKEPNREDEYGTSVISIQFSKGSHYLSIKNRYNHTVNNPDATFCNNLDNIITGLAQSFNKYFGYKTVQDDVFIQRLLQHCCYIKNNMGKLYKFNYEMPTTNQDLYFCPDNIVLCSGKTKTLTKLYDKSRYIVFDYYILDLKEKRFVECMPIDIGIFYESTDSIPRIINNLKVDKIETLKTEDGNKDIIFIKDNKKIVITVDKQSRIIKYYDEINEILPNYYLYENAKIEEITLVNTFEAGDFVGYDLYRLAKIKAPKLKKVGDHFLTYARVGEAEFPELEIVGDRFMQHFNGEAISLPRLKRTGDMFLYNSDVKNVDLSSLEETGKYFLFSSRAANVYLPKLLVLGENGFYAGEELETFIAPNLNVFPPSFNANYNANFKTLVVGNNNPSYLSEIANKYPSLENINNRSASYYRTHKFDDKEEIDYMKSLVKKI